MNTLDWIVIAIIGISAVTAYYKGFIYTIFKTLSNIVAIVISYVGYKPINTILRGTGFYTWLRKITMNMIAGGEVPKGITEQINFINGLTFPIPNSIKDGIIKNNNPEIYKILGANSFTEYIGGYIANFYLNIITFVVIYIVAKIALYIVGESLQIIAKLPVIRFADKCAGFGIGLIKGFIGVWIGAMVLAFLVALPQFQKVSDLLLSSVVAKWFYENNMIIQIIDQLFV